MTIYEVFNENLGRVPILAKQAEDTIRLYGWPEMRKKHAYIILDQLCGGGPLIKERCDCVRISLVELRLVLSPIGCGIKGSTVFNEQNIKEGEQYVIELISDINDVLKGVELRYLRFYNNENTCAFIITWEF